MTHSLTLFLFFLFGFPIALLVGVVMLHLWAEQVCRLRGHKPGPWWPVTNTFSDSGPYWAERYCQRCGACEEKEAIYIARGR